MASATHTGPIEIEQVNNTFYVSGTAEGFTTIQSAVDFVRVYHYSTGLIVVEQGVNVADSISAVTGGALGILILDWRTGNDQLWKWDGANYVPSNFMQAASIISKGVGPGTIEPASISLSYNPTDAGGWGAGNLIAFSSGSGFPDMRLMASLADGSEVANVMHYHGTPNALIELGADTLVQGGITSTGDIISATGMTTQNLVVNGFLAVNGDASFGKNLSANGTLWLGPGGPGINGTKGMLGSATPGFIDLQGMTQPGTYDQTIRLNQLGGNVQIGPNAEITEQGSVHAIRGKFSGPLRVYKGAGADPTLYSFWVGDIDPAPNAKGMTITESPSENAVDIQTVQIEVGFNQQLRLNHAGGTVWIGKNVRVTELGDIIAATGLTAQNLNITNVMHVGGPGGFDQLLSANGTFWLGPGGPGIAGTKGMLGSVTPGFIDLQGMTQPGTYDQTIRLNQLGGGVLVNGSPVRTFANTDISTLLTLTTTGSNGPSTLVGNTLNIPQYAGTGGGMIYPPTGISVSAGAAWGASINPADVPRLSTANTFTAAQTIQSDLTVSETITTAHAHLRLLARSLGLNAGSPNINADANNLVLNAAAGNNIYLNLDQGNGVVFGDGAGGNVASIDKTGTATINGGVSVRGFSNIKTGAANFGMQSDVTYIDSFGSGGGRGGFSFRIASAGAGNLLAPITVAQNGTATINGVAIWDRSVANPEPSISNISGAGNLVLNAVAANPVYLNYDSGTGGVKFGNGAQSVVATIDATGAAVFNGGMVATGFHTAPGGVNYVQAGVTTGSTPIFIWGRGEGTYGAVLNSDGLAITGFDGAYKLQIWQNTVNIPIGLTVGGAKSFLVPHPLDETKNLVHSCLEGPENGVFYRGEAVVVDGYALVTLPDYFEALTFTEDRSVQLTQIYEGTPLFARFAASRIVDGKFTIQATEDVTVAWEVKAVRRIGVEKLKVVADKPEPQPLPTMQDEKMEA